MIDAILHIASIQNLGDSLFGFDTTPLIRNGDAGLVYARANADDLAAATSLAGITVLARENYTGSGTADAVYGALFNDPAATALYDAVWPRVSQEVDDGEGGTTLWTPPERFGEMA